MSIMQIVKPAIAGAAAVYALRKVEQAAKMSGPTMGGTVGDNAVMPEIAMSNGVPATLWIVPAAAAFLIDRFA